MHPPAIAYVERKKAEGMTTERRFGASAAADALTIMRRGKART
jgi:hypothetical protein